MRGNSSNIRNSSYIFSTRQSQHFTLGYVVILCTADFSFLRFDKRVATYALFSRFLHRVRIRRRFDRVSCSRKTTYGVISNLHYQRRDMPLLCFFFGLSVELKCNQKEMSLGVLFKHGLCNLVTVCDADRKISSHWAGL